MPSSAKPPTSQNDSWASAGRERSSGSARSRLEATCPSSTAVASVAGHNSQARDASLPCRCPGRSSQAVAAPARHSGMAMRSMTNIEPDSRTDTPAGSSRVPPNPQ